MCAAHEKQNKTKNPMYTHTTKQKKRRKKVKKSGLCVYDDICNNVNPPTIFKNSIYLRDTDTLYTENHTDLVGKRGRMGLNA